MCFCMILSSCKLIDDLAPTPEDKTVVKDWLVVPVFYATTRKRAAGKGINFLEERADSGLQFGTKNVCVPKPTKLAVSPETIKRMGWQEIHLEKALGKGKKPSIDKPESCPIPDAECPRDKAAPEFDKFRERSGSKQVLIFVHGCCATFDTSLDRAAKIAAHMQIPLVIFDWDSPKGFTKYLENETLAQQFYDDFYAFLNGISKIVPPSDTIILGHSMGSHFVDDALLRRSERTHYGIDVPKFKEVIFCQPDSDARSYIRHNSDITSQTEEVKIFYNTRDGRLDASATAHGFPRLGRPEELTGQLCKLPTQDIIDITACATGHEIPFWVVADLTHGESTEPQGFECKLLSEHHYVLEKMLVKK